VWPVRHESRQISVPSQALTLEQTSTTFAPHTWLQHKAGGPPQSLESSHVRTSSSPPQPSAIGRHSADPWPRQQSSTPVVHVPPSSVHRNGRWTLGANALQYGASAEASGRFAVAAAETVAVAVAVAPSSAWIASGTGERFERQPAAKLTHARIAAIAVRVAELAGMGSPLLRLYGLRQGEDRQVRPEQA
jgi:hypothetical protein